jgi:hypothetical protein
MADGKKIIIDDDWKKEAAQEKEKLAEIDESSEFAGPMPAASFSSLVQMLAMQALIGLGGFAGAGGQEIPPNLQLAKHHIDLLDILDHKTANNLDPREKQLLDTTLHQLRMAYVESVRGAGSPGA